MGEVLRVATLRYQRRCYSGHGTLETTVPTRKTSPFVVSSRSFVAISVALDLGFGVCYVAVSAVLYVSFDSSTLRGSTSKSQRPTAFVIGIAESDRNPKGGGKP